MNSFQRLILGFAIVLTAAAASLAVQDTAPGASGSAPIEVKAKKYEFDPAVIKVKQGDHVKLVVTATDRDHGIKIAAYNIEQRLKKGEPTTIEFTADRAGTFPFECSVMCGLGHHKMKGELVVEPASGGAAASGTTP